MTPHRRSPYLRDRIADMPAFRGRERPLPMSPSAMCSRATASSLPAVANGTDTAALPHLAYLPKIGSIDICFDDSIPLGIVEIDGTRLTIDELRAAVDGT